MDGLLLDGTATAHADTFARDRLPPRDAWPELRFDLPALRYPARLNAAVALLDRHAHGARRDHPAVVTPSETLTYGELGARVARIANVLVHRLGLVPGNRVLLRGANDAWMVACTFAVLKAGGVVVATMPLLRAAELRPILAKARIAHALCDARLLAALTEAAGDDLRHIATWGATTQDSTTSDTLPADPRHAAAAGPPAGATPTPADPTAQDAGRAARSDVHRTGAPATATTHAADPSIASLEALCAEAPASFAACDTAAEDVALLGFTSGTTGVPKATMHFHRDLLAICDTYATHVLRPTPDDVFIGSPPLAFTFGLGGLVLFPFHVGATAVLLERASPEDLLPAIARHRATVCFTAPTAYRAMAANAAQHDLSSLRKCVSAGEALPRAIFETWEAATGLRLMDGIGSTELLHIFIAAPPEAIRPGSTGLPVPGYAARVIGPDGAEVPRGTPGRLAVQGPTGCRYLDDPRQADYVQDGWNVTGDTYVQDADGYFWYQARSDDMIVSAGYNIAGPEVEAALLTHPAVRECGVVGAPDPERGRIVKAYVVLHPDHPPTDALAKALQDHVKAAIAPYKYPRAVAFVPALPRTGTGKLQRYALRAQAAKEATE